jgi:hypothetical protein
LINLHAKAKNHGRSFDANFRDRAGSLLLALWPIMPANTLSMHQDCQVSDYLPDLKDQKSWTLCGHSVSDSGREHIDFAFANTASLYIIYASLRPISMQRNHDGKPNIVDAPLTFILPHAYLQYGTIHFGRVYQ